jgi:hypothetical protein
MHCHRRARMRNEKKDTMFTSELLYLLATAICRAGCRPPPAARPRPPHARPWLERAREGAADWPAEAILALASV